MITPTIFLTIKKVKNSKKIKKSKEPILIYTRFKINLEKIKTYLIFNINKWIRIKKLIQDIKKLIKAILEIDK